MNTILLLVVAACVAVGYYAWRQQQQSLAGLNALKNSGVQVAFWLRSRPLLAVDSSKDKLYLIDGSAPQSPVRVPFVSVKSVRFIESPPVSNDNTDPRGPDSLVITLHDGSEHRVGDLPDGSSGAKNAQLLFKNYQVLTDKLSFQSRH